MAAVESSSSDVSAEVLTYTLCSENRAYSEGRTEAGYIFFVLWERCFCMAANGIQEEYLFPNASISVLQTAHLAGIHKYKFKKMPRRVHSQQKSFCFVLYHNKPSVLSSVNDLHLHAIQTIRYNTK